MADDTRNPRQPLLESQLEEKFRTAVRSLLRGRTIKIAPTEKGAPDRLVLLPGGKIELVELKTDAGRISPAQRLWHDRAKLLGTTVHVIVGETGLLEWVSSRQVK